LHSRPPFKSVTLNLFQGLIFEQIPSNIGAKPSVSAVE